MDRSRIAIVIPALNEARTIARVTAAVASFGCPVVVDDGSSDGTGAFAAEAGAHVVRHDANQGYDAALNSGFAYAARAGFEYIVTLDADGQHNPSLITRFVSELDAGVEVVVGNRDRRQRLAEHLFAWTARWLWDIRDPLCGMKAYRVSAYLAQGHFDSYRSIGTELCLFAARRKMRISQVSVATLQRQDAPRFGNRWAANRKILRALVLGLVRR